MMEHLIEAQDPPEHIRIDIVEAPEIARAGAQAIHDKMDAEIN